MNRRCNGFLPMVMLVMALAMTTMKCNMTITTGTPESITKYVIDDNSLKSLTLSGHGIWDQRFKPYVLNYTYTVTNTVKSITITPKANSKKSKITINDREYRSNEESVPISLKDGKNEIDIQVTSESSDTKKYTIIIERLIKKSDENLLKSLVLSGNGEWDRKFEPNVLDYTYTVTDRIESITLTPEAKSKKVKITINGRMCRNNEEFGPISLKVGKKEIVIKVTAESGNVRKYTLMVERLDPSVGKSDDNLLKSLTLSGNGKLDQKFQPKVLEYTYTITNTVKSITLIPEANSKKAKITINGRKCGSNEKSRPISQKVGKNVIYIRVTAENGDVRKYTLMVERLAPGVEKSNDNLLKSLILTGNGKLDQKFQPKVLNYTYTVQNTVGSITLTPEANSNKAKITVNGRECGSNKKSGPISLKVGKNEIVIGVTAENGDVRKYIVKVERLAPSVKKSDDNLLKSLILSDNGTWDRKFKPDVLNYTYKVSSAIESITLIPEANSKKAKITINGKECGSNEKSGPISLKVGKNEISIQVTAENGDPRKYSVIVTRLDPKAEKDDNVTLSSLTVSGATLIPDFNPFILKYTAFIPETKVPFDVKAVAESVNATIILKLNGKVVENQQGINFTGSKATLDVEVTAGNGLTKRIYTIAITKISGRSDSSLRGSETVEKGEIKK